MTELLCLSVSSKNWRIRSWSFGLHIMFINVSLGLSMILGDFDDNHFALVLNAVQSFNGLFRILPEHEPHKRPSDAFSALFIRYHFPLINLTESLEQGQQIVIVEVLGQVGDVQIGVGDVGRRFHAHGDFDPFVADLKPVELLQGRLGVLLTIESDESEPQGVVSGHVTGDVGFLQGTDVTEQGRKLLIKKILRQIIDNQFAAG